MGKKRTYKADNGDYLVLAGEGDCWRIYWYIKQWSDVGACVGEEDPNRPLQKCKDEWETWRADQCVKDLADGRDSVGFFFEEAKAARRALQQANEGLLNADAKPWPAWALAAKEAGWTPPSGWTP